MSLIPTEPTGRNSCLPSPEARARNMAAVLSTIQGHKWTLASFLRDLFSPDQGKYVTSQMQIQMVSYFLGPCSTFGADELTEMMYVHKYSKPKCARASQNRSAQEVVCEDRENMAREKLQSWAISKVENLVNAEATIMSSKETGFHMDRTHQSWEAIE